MTNNLIIIGSGPAAWTAAIYASRAALSPIVLAGEQGGGQLMLTTRIENYPGFPEGILGPELMAGMRRQAEKHGVRIIDKNATGLKKSENSFTVMYGEPISEHSENSESQKVGKSENQKAGKENLPDFRSSEGLTFRNSESSEFSANSVIVATGAVANTLKLPGEDRLMGRGVGTCAVCDAPFYRGKDMVLVIGGGDSAMEEAGELSKFVKKVVILVRKDTMRASAIMVNRIKSLQNVEIWYKTEVKEFIGEKRLEKVKIIREGKEEGLAVDGAFYAIGHTPATGWLAGSGVEIDAKGYIMTLLSAVISPAKFSEHSENSDSQKVRKSESQKAGNSGSPALRFSDLSGTPSIPSFPTMTTMPGIFAAGDCVDSRYRQAITAAGFGAMAALDAQKWLESR